MKLKKGSLNLKLALLMILLIPIFFGFRVEFLMPFSLQSTVFDIIIIVAASAGLLFFGYFIIIRTLDEEAIKIMHEHEVVNAFINKKAKPILINFSITMVLEELIFRFYIIGVLDLFLGYLIALFLSSIIFSLL